MLEKVSERLRRALERAARFGVTNVSPTHLLLAILLEREGGAVALLRTLDLDPAVLAGRLQRLLSIPEPAPASSPEAPVSAKTVRLLALEEDFRRWPGHGRTGTEHVLLALVSAGNDRPVELLTEMGVDSDRAYAALLAKLADPPRRSRRSAASRSCCASSRTSRPPAEPQRSFFPRPDTILRLIFANR